MNSMKRARLLLVFAACWLVCTGSRTARAQPSGPVALVVETKGRKGGAAEALRKRLSAELDTPVVPLWQKRAPRARAVVSVALHEGGRAARIHVRNDQGGQHWRDARADGESDWLVRGIVRALSEARWAVPLLGHQVIDPWGHQPKSYPGEPYELAVELLNPFDGAAVRGTGGLYRLTDDVLDPWARGEPSQPRETARELSRPRP
jgi:hypothetical protein